MQLTTLNIIKILPIEEQNKQELLANFDTYSREKKFLIEQIVWGVYDALFKSTLEEKLELGRLEAEKNNRELGPDFYDKMRKEAEEEIMSQSVSAVEKVDLDVARQQLASVISEENTN
jgi:beta-glucosidase/6-phospho-beta-glucosidase/beta-galactosidase